MPVLPFLTRKNPKPPRKPHPITIYTAIIWIVVAVLLLMLLCICAVQTIDAQRAHITAAAYQSRNTELEAEIEQAQEEKKALEEQNRLLEKQTQGVTLADQLDSATFAYQTKYPAMIVQEQPLFQPADDGAVYLTFDDGPSQNTKAILDALKAANAHATFFVVGGNFRGYEDLLKRMVAEGHTIGIHSYTHNYKQVYASVEDYLDDFYKTYDAIYKACGVYPTIFRFPGGSINGHSMQIYQPLIAELVRRGFVYYDWSVDSQDEYAVNVLAQQNAVATTQDLQNIVDNLCANINGTNHPIVLLHDAGKYGLTAQFLPELLQRIKGLGYSCEALTNTVEPQIFTYTDW